ncbi:hypothetical protein SK128_007758, partial [Halocaridina rubra]
MENGQRTSSEVARKIHQCVLCPYSTNKKYNLQKHYRVHTGEKPFACPHCPYRASQKSNVMAHISTHKQFEDGTKQ